MKLKTNNKQVIRETGWGCYVWQLPDGTFLSDDEDRAMLVFTIEHDRAAIKAITDAARHYGFPDGKAVYWPDQRPVSDEEFENQQARALAGLTPDIWDVGAAKDELEAIRRGN